MGNKVKDMRKGSAVAKYFRINYGNVPLAKACYAELVTFLFGTIPGAIGYALRKIFYPAIFRSCGKKVLFGRSLTFRHPCKIDLGDGVIIDDCAVLDAKGDDNKGITLANGVFIGRNTKVYCKGGDIELGEKTNLSSNCTLYSNNRLTIGKGCMIGAYTYILSGGEYNPMDPLPYAEQDGMNTKGPLTIGDDCWLGARVTILDGAATIGDRALIAACALVTKPVEAHTLVAGVPAKKIKDLP